MGSGRISRSYGVWFCCIGVSRDDFMKLMQHSEIPQSERYGLVPTSYSTTCMGGGVGLAP